MTPWTDRAGRFSPLKTCVFVGLLLPALWLGWLAMSGGLGPRPYNDAIHRTGSWAIRFLVLSLAVTPLRRILDWPKLILVRRMIGLAALFYALGHLCLYILDMSLDLGRVVSEIFNRIYLTIGFAALLGLVVLGVTSNDAAIRRLGGNWNRLHRIVYAIAILAAVHFFMQTKADVYEATLVAGLLILLLSYRVVHAAGGALASAPLLAGVAVAGGLLTAAAELAWYGLATAIPVGRVLEANLHFSYMVRPAWWVAGVGLAVALAAVARARIAPRRAPARGGRMRASAA